MKDEELEATKPIDIEVEDVEDVPETRTEKYEDVGKVEETRTEKFEKKIEEAETKEAEEAAEEALAEKNIAKAEEIEKEEKEAEEAKEEVSDESLDEEIKKESLIVKFKNWWKYLEKPQKIVFIIVGVLFLLLLILLIVGIVSLFIKPKQKEEEPKPTIEEVSAPVLFDGYYYQDGSLYFLDEGRAEIGSYECENKDEELCSIGTNRYKDSFDVPKVVSEDGTDRDEQLRIINNNFVFIRDAANKDSKVIKLYSMRDKEVKGTYNEVKLFDDNTAIVADITGKYGLLQIGEDVTTLIASSYDYLGLIYGQKNLIAKNNKGYIVIDRSNKTQSSVIPGNHEIKNYNDKYIITKVNGTYSVYNYKAVELSKEHYFAVPVGAYYAFVDNKRLFINDEENNKYTEEGIELKSTSYVKTFVYDSNGSLVDSKKSFEIEDRNNEFNIAIFEDGNKEATYVQINQTESIVNRTLSYVSYFDGKLYFYRDDAKTDLIGSYKCNNKNEVSPSNGVYSTCYIAYDTVFSDNDMMKEGEDARQSTVPLMNNKYVVIRDGGNSVVLYDIVAGQIKATYSSVDSNTADNRYAFTSATGKFDIIGFNKKGKYGVIRIDGENVTALHVFNYNKIEKVGNFFEGQDTNGKWSLLSNGQTSGLFNNKIQGYSSDIKYVKTAANGKYSVYKISGEAVSSDTYNYVELYSGFYAGVDSSNKLKIYDYTGKALTKDSVEIKSKDYTRTNTPAFRVKQDGKNYKVSVYENDAYKDYTLKTGTEEPEPDPDEPDPKPDEPDPKPDEPDPKPDEPDPKPDEPDPKPDEPSDPESLD